MRKILLEALLILPIATMVLSSCQTSSEKAAEAAKKKVNALEERVNRIDKHEK